MYNEEVKKLFDKLDDIQKALIEDLDAESLKPDDIEFEKMVNERALSSKQKEEIFKFYKDKAKLKTECYLKELHEIERNTIEDLLAEGLYPGDPEFDYMLIERSVNKENIYRYFDNKKEEFLLNYNTNEKNFINQMIKDGIKVGDKEFDEKIKDTKYDKDKIIKYYNNIKWIDKNNEIIKNIEVEKEEKKKKEIEEKKKLEEEKKKLEEEKKTAEENKNKETKENKKEEDLDEDYDDDMYKDYHYNSPLDKKREENYDPYKGLNYYQRLARYAKEKTKHPSNLDSYDDELRQMQRMEEFNSLPKKEKINKLKEIKKWLSNLKDLTKKEDLDDTDVKKLGFINAVLLSIISIILCVIFTFIFKIFV